MAGKQAERLWAALALCARLGTRSSWLRHWSGEAGSRRLEYKTALSAPCLVHLCLSAHPDPTSPPLPPPSPPPIFPLIPFSRTPPLPAWLRCTVCDCVWLPTGETRATSDGAQTCRPSSRRPSPSAPSSITPRRWLCWAPSSARPTAAPRPPTPRRSSSSPRRRPRPPPRGAARWPARPCSRMAWPRSSTPRAP